MHQKQEMPLKYPKRTPKCDLDLQMTWFFKACLNRTVGFCRSDSWQLVQTHCLPSSSNSIGCSPFQFHEATIYNAVNTSSWKRITIQLPDHVSSR